MLPPASARMLQLLSTLRWLAIVGQVVTVAVVTGPLQVDLADRPLWAGIATLAAFNLYAMWRSRQADQPRDAEVFAHMLVDVIALSWLVAWSGGVENPFSSLFLLPIALSILALPGRWIAATAVASVAGFALSAWFARSLPHVHGGSGDLFNLHKLGMLVNFAVSAAVLLVFFTRMARAAREREREVARLRESFARNEGIVALATHAASVAHELNTPLGTLALMVEDLAAEPGSGARREDLVAMRRLLEACRDRVRELARPADVGMGRDASGTEVERVIERWQLVRPAIELRRTGATRAAESVDSGVGHLLQVLLNNAADASEQAGSRQVDLHIEVKGQGMRAAIRDYGAGFGRTTPALPGTLFRTDKPDGLGLGLALSHATVERLGGTLSMEPAADGPGIVVSFELPLAVLA